MSIFNENDRRVKKLSKIADKVEALAPVYKAMSDAELVSQTDKLKARLSAGETLDTILPEAYATVREAGERVECATSMFSLSAESPCIRAEYPRWLPVRARRLWQLCPHISTRSRARECT